MGKTILTSQQLNFLEFAQAQPAIVKNFYLTGGTALSEFYLHHRLSEDIDLFSEQEVKFRQIESILKGKSSVLGVKSITKENFLGLYSYKLKYGDGAILKVDFNYYPFPKIETGVYWKKLEVSSIYDIAVNKIHTVTMRSRARDYIDLYFIMKKMNNQDQYLEKIRIDSQAKFDWPLEPKGIAQAFLRVKDLPVKDLPTMLVPFDKKKMEDFFLSLAKSLKKEIFA